MSSMVYVMYFSQKLKETEITEFRLSKRIPFTMSSDEDFSLVMETPPSEKTLEEIKDLISSYKKQYDQLIQEQKDLTVSRDDKQDLVKQFRLRSDKVTQILKDEQRAYADQLESERAKLDLLKREEAELMTEIQRVGVALKEQETYNDCLREQTSVFTAVPEKRVMFSGQTADPTDTPMFDMKPCIVYPMEGGTALMTFEEEVVAKKILAMGKHEVDLGSECRIVVEAKPVHVMMPSLVEIDTEVCPRRILLSNLPNADTEFLLSKLENHFSKTRHGGGEVEQCEMLQDLGNVVITFLKNDVARGLVEKEFHEVEIKTKKKHQIRATPFLNGKITNFKKKMSMCPRTVLLTGIPDVMEQENLQDLLEIHFQKSSNGGGEIDAFLYNPLGRESSATFEGDGASCPERDAAAL
ncbi:hypothetical protein LDENG_00135540 [Lucifuga dentata]|nr:hypothetical protein LDENG_00135540 [Lucifuga dentata]